MSDIKISKGATGWVLTSGQIKVHCVNWGRGKKVMLDIPYDELSYSQVHEIIEMLWRARAWMQREQNYGTEPPLMIEPPSMIGYRKARQLYQFHGPQRFMEALDDVMRNVVQRSRIRPEFGSEE